jgi:hypothetical protein
MNYGAKFFLWCVVTVPLFCTKNGRKINNIHSEIMNTINLGKCMLSVQNMYTSFQNTRERESVHASMHACVCARARVCVHCMQYNFNLEILYRSVTDI